MFCVGSGRVSLVILGAGIVSGRTPLFVSSWIKYVPDSDMSDSALAWKFSVRTRVWELRVCSYCASFGVSMARRKIDGAGWK